MAYGFNGSSGAKVVPAILALSNAGIQQKPLEIIGFLAGFGEY